MFSPFDSDIVFTGSADHSVHSWRVSKDLHNEVVDFKSKLMLFFVNKFTTESINNILIPKYLLF